MDVALAPHLLQIQVEGSFNWVTDSILSIDRELGAPKYTSTHTAP